MILVHAMAHVIAHNYTFELCAFLVDRQPHFGASSINICLALSAGASFLAQVLRSLLQSPLPYTTVHRSKGLPIYSSSLWYAAFLRSRMLVSPRFTAALILALLFKQPCCVPVSAWTQAAVGAFLGGLIWTELGWTCAVSMLLVPIAVLFLGLIKLIAVDLAATKQLY